MRLSVLIVVFSIIMVSCKSKMNNTTNLEKLVETEVQFAELSKKAGRGIAFYKFFDDSAVVFSPQKVVGKERYRNVNNIPNELLWYPEFADISASGEIGFTTGPWIFNVNGNDTAQSFGNYFSIWKKRADEWKVIFDCGISYPQKNNIHIKTKLFDSKNIVESPQDYDSELRYFKKCIEDFNYTLNNSYVSEAYNAFSISDTRIYREGEYPSESLKGYLCSLSKKRITQKVVESKIDLSKACDFGYEIGTLEISNSEGDITNHNYCRVWRQTNNGWKILFDVQLDLI